MTQPEGVADGSAAREFLLRSHQEAGNAITESTVANGAPLGALLQLDLDIRAWELRLTDRPEHQQISDARRDLAFAIYAATAGLYVHAYAGLRLFLELSFAAVYFSANELHRRQWSADRADFSWSKALDPDEGVLSHSFVREFSESAASDASKYAADAAQCYRHCSQFVHGKLAVTRTLPESLSFDPVVLADWLASATRAARSVLYLLYARYGDELLGTDDGALMLTLESSFSHIAAVRTHIGLPVEQESTRAR